MKWVVHCIFLHLLPVVTYVESMRNVETNQKNVHRTHIFNMLHKTHFFPAKQMLQHKRKSDHSIQSNKNYQESRLNVNNYIFKLKEVNTNRTPVNNLRKRSFSFVSTPYQMNLETHVGAVHRVNAGQREQEFLSGNTSKQHRKSVQKRRRNAVDNAHHVFKRAAPSLHSSSQDTDRTVTDGGLISRTPVPSTILPNNSLPSQDLIPKDKLLQQSETLLNSSQNNSNDNSENFISKSSENNQEIPKNSPTTQDLITPTNAASVNKKTHHLLTTTARRHTTLPKSESISPKAPSKRPIPVTPVQQQHADMTIPLQKPTENGVNPNVEEVQERTSETECKNGQCTALDGPISRFSDATWAVGSMTFILMLLTVSVLYTGLWKKRNQFLYGFKSREESAVSQHHLNRTNVSDMIRRLKSTKKNEMIRLKRMFGSKYNRVPLVEGSDIEEDDSSV